LVFLGGGAYLGGGPGRVRVRMSHIANLLRVRGQS
jgi:hypothetical protein